MSARRMARWLALAILATGCRGSKQSARGSDAAGAVSAAPSAAPLSTQPVPSASAAASAAAPVPAACPPQMALVEGISGHFCIDRWEGATVDQEGAVHSPYHAAGPAPVVAVSRSGVVPQAYICLVEADDACRRAGKRLCTTQQWIDACTGGKRPGRTYPYGTERIAGACNVSRPIHPSSLVHGTRREDSLSLNDPRLNQQQNTVARTGEFERCVTPEGVYDLHGNLLEWTRGDKPLLMGGYYLDGSKHGPGCTYVTDGHAANYHDFSTGFRCCKQPDPRRLAAWLEAQAGSAAAPDPAAGAAQAAVDDAGSAVRDPRGMRGFTSNRGRLPSVRPPAYASAHAPCPVDMVHVAGLRCTVALQTCLRWLPRRSAGKKIACAEFQQPSECRGPRRRMEFCIDRYEFTPPGYTYPLTHVNWTEAQNLCRAMDKRLCLEQEWEFACEGPQALPYPYGYVRDARRCNHDFPERELVTAQGRFIDRRVRADAVAGCVSPFGVVGLVGNVDEWTTRAGAEPPRRSILRGGWWLIGRNRCRAATANHSEIYAGMQTGFRCCKAARRSAPSAAP